MLNLGIDVGGSKVEAGIVDSASGEMFESLLFKFPPSGKKEELLSLFEQIIKSFDLSKIEGIGIGFPSSISDYKRGILYFDTKPKLIGLHGFNMINFLQKITKKKVVMNNDTCCFALSEYKFGKLSGKGKLLGLILGTGFGVASVSKDILVDEKLFSIPYRGKIADEYISARGLLLISKELGFKFVNPESVTQSAKEGGNGLKVYQKLGDMLGEIITPLVSENNYNAIVIGGSVGKKGFNYFLPSLLKRLNKPQLTIYKSTFKNAGIIGAALLPTFDLAK